MRRLNARGRRSTTDEEANLVGNDSIQTGDGDENETTTGIDEEDELGPEMTIASTAEGSTSGGYVVFQDPGMAGSNFDIGEAPSPDRVQSPPPTEARLINGGSEASDPKEGDLAAAAGELSKARTPSPLLPDATEEPAGTKTPTMTTNTDDG